MTEKQVEKLNCIFGKEEIQFLKENGISEKDYWRMVQIIHLGIDSNIEKGLMQDLLWYFFKDNVKKIKD